LFNILKKIRAMKTGFLYGGGMLYIGSGGIISYD